MKKLLIIASLILCFAVEAMDNTQVEKIASQTVLAQRLKDRNWGHFDEKTNISKTLAGQSKDSVNIQLALRRAIHDYGEKTASPISAQIIFTARLPELTAIFLE